MTTSVVATVARSENAVSVYTGATLPELRAITCGRGFFGEEALFRATAGVTYHLAVTGSPANGTDTLSVREAPLFRPAFSADPFDPSIFEQTSFFYDQFGDPFLRPVVGGEWSFGDGTTGPFNENGTRHHFTVDGTYQVGLTATTEDGRTGTGTRQVTVRTHDVSIDKFATPAKARTGDSKPTSVQVFNDRYREASVTTELYKSVGANWALVGTLTLDVPAQAAHTVKFPFAYTFTAADAVAGKVAFRAVVRLSEGVRDARPFDNELISVATTVQPSLTDLRFA